MNVTRRKIQVGLGLLWLLDAGLQFQPFMFGTGFGSTELAPAGVGQPGIVSHPVHWVAQLVIAHPVVANTAFALVQAALGIGLLARRTTRVALVASIAWAVSVWWLGEGLGGLTTGETLLTGAPGAALLYALVALFAFPDRTGDSSITPSRWALPAWAGLWAMGAGLQLAAGNDTGGSFSAMFRDAASDNGGWIRHIDARLGGVHYANGAVAALIAIEVVVAMWTFVPGVVRNISLIVGSLLAVTFWLLVQGLGNLTSGQATDPNSGPLVLLLAVAAFGAASAQLTEEHSMTLVKAKRAAAVAGTTVMLVAAGSASAGAAPSGDRAPAAHATKLTITESDYHIALSSSSGPAGTYALVVENASPERHGLVFNGPGQHRHLVFYIKAHSTKRATILLGKGSYDVYCPVPGHKMLGMNTHFTVN